MNQLFYNISTRWKFFFLEGFVCWRHERAQQEYEARSRSWIWLDKFTSYVIKKSEALDPQVLHTMTFVDKYILLDVLVCSIAEYFCELCRILTSLYGDSKYKQRRFRSALQQNSASRLLCLLKTSLTW